MTVTGKDYLVPPHAAGTPVSGGIYVFFGWVDATKKWGPSGRNVNNNDGNFGTTYLYPGEQGSQNSANAGGSIGNVAFTPGGEGADGAATMNDNGDWTTTIEVPGASFTTALPGGGSRTTNCLQVSCGIFTIGAHGKASATNEKFTPVTFTGSTASASPTPTPKATTSVTTSGGATSSPEPSVDPLPKTGIDDSLPANAVVRPEVPLDGQTVALRALDERDSGSAGGWALFGVAALVLLVVALSGSIYLRFRNSDGAA